MGEMAAEDLDLRLTLESGQFFRYAREGDSYILITSGKRISLRQEGGLLIYSGASPQFIRGLFQLDAPYSAQVARLSRDRKLAPLLRRYPGLRVMRQNLHETIIGFICSSNSNIPKIRMNLDLIAQHCGERAGDHHHLPAPGVALNYDLVRAAKTGYRARFIVDANRMLDDRMLSAIRRADYAGSHGLLCTLPGVGPKIADCICVFALGHGEAFPVDVHILRAMRNLFPEERFRDERAVRYFAQQRWGEDAGLAQQFIYQWARDTLAGRDPVRQDGKRVKRKVAG